jgi:hypothetical protein
MNETPPTQAGLENRLAETPAGSRHLNPGQPTETVSTFFITVALVWAR